MFYDRYEAGADLAEELTQYKDTEAVVCAIPRGGVLTGIAVAKRLHVPLELMVVGTVEHVTDEASISYVVTETGEYVSAAGDVMPEAELTRALELAKSKRLAYTDKEELPDWKDKTVIVVDDGAESGLTIKAVVTALQVHKPKKIVVALPAASASVVAWLQENVDEVVVIKAEPEFKGVIHEHFSHYPEVFDKDVHVAYWHAKHLYEQYS